MRKTDADRDAFRRRVEAGEFMLKPEDIMGKWKIEVYSRRGLFGRRWYFRIRADNGEVVAQSEGYQNKLDCHGTISRLQARVIRAEVIEVTK